MKNNFENTDLKKFLNLDFDFLKIILRKNLFFPLQFTVKNKCTGRGGELFQEFIPINTRHRITFFPENCAPVVINMTKCRVVIIKQTVLRAF